MEPAVQAQPSPKPANFAGLLASLALPLREADHRSPEWSTDDLGEDVATLSYERALQAHARYRPADCAEWKATPAAEVVVALAEQPPALNAKVGEGAVPLEGSDRDLRQASVTIRLSKAECARLHQRAAEARLTVSAYLRSRTFEAEALRAQVKEALSQLRSASGQVSVHQMSQKNNEIKQHGAGIRLTRVLGHIGNLCLGFSTRT
jgi:hypothetical protein